LRGLSGSYAQLCAMIAEELHGQGIDDRGGVADIGGRKNEFIARRI